MILVFVPGLLLVFSASFFFVVCLFYMLTKISKSIIYIKSSQNIKIAFDKSNTLSFSPHREITLCICLCLNLMSATAITLNNICMSLVLNG